MSERVAFYIENENRGNPCRNRMLKETLAFLETEKQRAGQARKAYFRPDTSSLEAYGASIEPYRQAFQQVLGLPYFDRFDPPDRLGLPGRFDPQDAPAEVEQVGEDAFAKISRVWVPVLPGLSLYGILFENHVGRAPLVLVQHGGQGTPELCGGFFGSENYNEIVRRFLLRGVHVFAPQLLLYKAERFGDAYDRPAIDNTLKQLGTTFAALQVFELRRGIDWLARLPFVDAGRIGMAGLSYGGFFTLLTAAAEPRIRAAYVSSFFNDRFRYNWLDMSLPGQAERFMDAEMAALVCPRPLWLESGRDDELFDAAAAQACAKPVAALYGRLGIPERFRFALFEGTHEFCKQDGGVDFLLSFLQ